MIQVVAWRVEEKYNEFFTPTLPIYLPPGVNESENKNDEHYIK